MMNKNRGKIYPGCRIRRRNCDGIDYGLLYVLILMILPNQVGGFLPSLLSTTGRSYSDLQRRRHSTKGDATSKLDSPSTTATLPLPEMHPDLLSDAVLRPRSRLKVKHRYMFQPDDGSPSLFHRLGLVMCETGVVSKKEFLETYAAASTIHHRFPDSRRIADMAAGHGLLSWVLLVMDDVDDADDVVAENDDNEGTRRPPRTAVCIDRRKPKASQVIANAMMQAFPSLDNAANHRWAYNQSDLQQVIPHPSTLLVSVHACGTLTDLLIDLSIVHQTALAIVPCCHTVKKGSLYEPHPRYAGVTASQVIQRVKERKKQLVVVMNAASSSKDTDHPGVYAKHNVVADVVDEVRVSTLRNAGFEVDEVFLPETFTIRNRLLLAEPTASSRTLTIKTRRNLDPVSIRRNQLPPIIPTAMIPLADDPQSIAYCRSMSSSISSSSSSSSGNNNDRPFVTKRQNLPPFKEKSLSLAVAIWLPTTTCTTRPTSQTNDVRVQLLHDNSHYSSYGDDLDYIVQETIERLYILGNQCGVKHHIRCEAYSSGNLMYHQAHQTRKEKQLWQLFKFKYYWQSSGGNTTAPQRDDPSSRVTVRLLHDEVRTKIVDELGYALR